MASKIEWTGETWNPLRGCTKVKGSAGCDNCYAMGIASRFSGPGMTFEGVAKMVHGKPHWTGKIRLVPEKLADPLGWKTPRTIFVNSMSDLFHEGVPDEFIDQVFAVMALTPQHTYQILTKRAERMAEYQSLSNADDLGSRWAKAAYALLCNRDPGEAPAWPLPNVWLGVSVEDASTLDRLDILRDIPNALPWVSLEPLLGPVDIRPYLDFLKWVVLGGESGPNARPMEEGWARSVKDQCAAAGVAFFMKQGSKANWSNYKNFKSFPDDLKNREFPNAL